MRNSLKKADIWSDYTSEYQKIDFLEKISVHKFVVGSLFSTTCVFTLKILRIFLILPSCFVPCLSISDMEKRKSKHDGPDTEATRTG